ncbi:MAG: tetratricopeptide repeat protein [Candidatus Hermodarchaeota archaeon]
MSRTEEITYPPEDILNPRNGKTDYEYIILWMLNANDLCQWSDFTVEISGSTLHGYLKKLLNKGYIDRPERNQYRITAKGRDRFSEATYDRKLGKRKLKYPPKAILKRRNYDHWILWMLSNNYSCKWSDFKQEPLSINQSSLSSTLNILLDKQFVVRNNKEYTITSTGKIEYLRILKLYDLDRQSILEQESKRIEEITEKTKEFFNKYKIEIAELKFRYLDLVLKLPYSKVKTVLKDEQDFNKILLFLAINHPDNYPNYISPEVFSGKYDIDRISLNYYINEIVDNQFFQIEFFKLEDDKDRIYYFQKNEPLEKLLNATVEKHITKITYLNKFQRNPTINIDQLLEKIINDICIHIFHNGLRESLRDFLPNYIKNSAYKIESEKKLIDSEAKLEGFVWQNIFEEFQTFEPSASVNNGSLDEYYYTLDKQIFDVLDIMFISKLNFITIQEFKNTANLKKVKILDEFIKLLYRSKISRAKNLYRKTLSELDEIQKLILNDILVTEECNFKKSINITTELIRKFPSKFIGYLLQSISYFLMDDYENALKVIEEGFKNAPHVLLLCQKAQIFIKVMRQEEILSEINEALLNNPQHILLLRIKYALILTHTFNNYLRSGDDPLNVINNTIKIRPNDKELLVLKSLFYFLINKYKEGKELLIKEIGFNIFNKNPKIDIPAFFLLVFSYTAKGKFDKAFKIANQLNDIYPNHPISYLTKAIVMGYNLIYGFKLQDADIDTFKELIEKAISLERLNYKKVKYLLFQARVFHEIKYEGSINIINNAIDIIPTLSKLYAAKAYFLMTNGKEFEALNLIDETVHKNPNLKYILHFQKSFILFGMKRYEESLKIIDELLKTHPNGIKLLNNKAIFLAFMGKKDEAIETVEYLISLNPNLGNSYDTYGEILMNFKDYENAIKKYEHALKIESLGGFTFQTCAKLGLCYQELKKYDQALKYFEKGKLLTERMIPSERELYLHKSEEYLSELKILMNKSNDYNNMKN